jgi:hypothetical protein
MLKQVFLDGLYMVMHSLSCFFWFFNHNSMAAMAMRFFKWCLPILPGLNSFSYI